MKQNTAIVAKQKRLYKKNVLHTYSAATRMLTSLLLQLKLEC